MKGFITAFLFIFNLLDGVLFSLIFSASFFFETGKDERFFYLFVSVVSFITAIYLAIKEQTYDVYHFR